MTRAVLSSKDFWSGLLFMGMGAAALILGSDLRAGTQPDWTGLRPARHRLDTDRTGCRDRGERICARCGAGGSAPFAAGSPHPRLSVIVFALLLQPAGLIPAMIAMIAISAPAAGQVRARQTVGIAVFLILLCVLIFKVMLEMSFPVIAEFGEWTFSPASAAASSIALTLKNILYCFTGALIGTLIGVLPGIGPLATITADADAVHLSCRSRFIDDHARRLRRHMADRPRRSC